MCCKWITCYPLRSDVGVPHAIYISSLFSRCQLIMSFCCRCVYRQIQVVVGDTQAVLFASDECLLKPQTVAGRQCRRVNQTDTADTLFCWLRNLLWLSSRVSVTLYNRHFGRSQLLTYLYSVISVAGKPQLNTNVWWILCHAVLCIVCLLIGSLHFRVVILTSVV